MRLRTMKVLGVTLLSFTLLACATSPEKARVKLDEMNVPYTADAFVQKASEGMSRRWGTS